MAFAIFVCLDFMPFSLASASEVLWTRAASRGNSTSPLLPVKSQSLTSFLPTWRIQLEEQQAKFYGWMVLNGNKVEKILVLAVLVTVMNAFWAWGFVGLEACRDWWEERGRVERFRGWMVEERRMRRERCAMVGILRGRGGKVEVRKKVSFEGVEVDGEKLRE